MEALGETGDAPEVGSGRRARGTDELDRHIEQAFQSLLDEVAHIVRQQRPVDPDAALGREPAEPDRGTAEPERVA